MSLAELVLKLMERSETTLAVALQWLADAAPGYASHLRSLSDSFSWRTMHDARLLALFIAGFTCADIVRLLPRLKLSRQGFVSRLECLVLDESLLGNAHAYISAHPLIGLRSGGQGRSAPTSYWNDHREQIIADAIARCDSIDVAVGHLMKALGRSEPTIRYHLTTHHNIDPRQARRRPEYRGSWGIHADAQLIAQGQAGRTDDASWYVRRQPNNEVAIRSLLLTRDRRRLNMVRGFLGALPSDLHVATAWPELARPAWKAPMRRPRDRSPG